MLRLENARHALNFGYPILEVEVDGKPCRLSTESVKPYFEDQGLLFIGEEFGCPPVTLRPDGGEEQTFEGFSDDAGLMALWRAFGEACEADEFVEGPVAIPVPATA